MPALSAVVIVLSLMVRVCLIRPVCLNPFVFTAAQFTSIVELIISPEDCWKNTPKPLSVILTLSSEMYEFSTLIMFIPLGEFPHVPPASPVNVELEILIGSDIPAPAPKASIAYVYLAGKVYPSTPKVKVESVIVGFANSVKKIFEELTLVKTSPLAVVFGPSNTSAAYLTLGLLPTK